MEAAPLHRPDLAPCPYLPPAPVPLGASCLSAAGTGRGEVFYTAALHYAQSLWLQGWPARALLLINRAMGCALTGRETVLIHYPVPYKAVAWILRNRRPDQFTGNPRRHWQHLATRMVEPRRELRTWRAWACWRMACLALPDLPGDSLQITRENLTEPGEATIRSRLESLGLPGEAGLWNAALRLCLSP